MPPMIVAAFLLVMVVASSDADYADITTIYKFQLDSDNTQSKNPLSTKCDVYIHTGLISKHLPYVVDSEIVFPKLKATPNTGSIDLEEIQNKTTKANNFDTSSFKTNAIELQTNVTKYLDRFDSKTNKTEDEDLDSLLKFDSNNLADTRWIFDGRSYHIQQVQNIDTSKLGNLFSKTIKQIKVNFILNEADQIRLNNIVAKDNNSKSMPTKIKHSTSNVPNVIKLSKSFENVCEGCRFDFYKTKNGTKWDLLIIRNYGEQNDKGFKESTEDSLELDNKPINEIQNDEPTNLKMKDDRPQLRVNDIENESKIPKVQTIAVSTKEGIRSRRSQTRTEGDLKPEPSPVHRTGEGQVDNVDTILSNSEPMPNEQNNEMKSSIEEILVPSKNKLLLSYDQRDDMSEDSILKTTLTENATYLLTIQFKTQSYFKVTFLMDNATNDVGSENRVFETIEVTVRGTCEDAVAVDTKDLCYYVEVNTGREFKTLTINTTDLDGQNETLKILFRSRHFVQITNGFLNHQIALQGAQLYDIEFYNICFDSGFNWFQFELSESVSSYFSTSVQTGSTSSRPSLTSPWFKNRNQICWTILFTNMSRSSSDYKYACYDDDDDYDSVDKIGIQVNVENGDGHERQIHKYCVETNGDIDRLIITYNKNNTDAEVIRFLIEVENNISIRYIYNNICTNDLYLVKQGICDDLEKVSYDVAYKHNFYKRVSSVEYCSNEGSLVEGRCLCPPGFVGKHCEEACGENKFGQDCSGQCARNTSTTGHISRQCQGMLLCAPYGCGCAPGYQGKYCTQLCANGFYGNDCKSRCGQCLNYAACNIYSGHCYLCASNYLVHPYCQESYPYLTTPPRLINTSYFSVQVEVDAHPQNIKGYSSEIGADYLIKILTKDLTWKTEQVSREIELDLANPNSSENTQKIWIHNLVPGHLYSFQVLLLDDIGNTHDPIRAPLMKQTTKCIIPAYAHEVKLDVTSTTAQLYWQVTNVSYEAWNETEEINELYDLNSTINQINRLFNYTTNVQVMEDLYNLTQEEIHLVFKCRKQTEYSLTVKKITRNGKAQEFKFNNLHSGFTLKHLDPGNKYMVKLVVHNNGYSYEILSSIVETKGDLSEMDDLELVRKLEKSVFLKWNSNHGRRFSPMKKHKVTNTTTNNNGLNPSKGGSFRADVPNNQNVTQHDTNQTEVSSLRVETIYYIKYKIVKQRACGQFFNHNPVVIATNKTDYKLELDYFTTYSIFVTQNKGQSIANHYLYAFTAASVPDISPNLLHTTRVANDSAQLVWADISLSNYECAQMNGMFVTYELVLRRLRDGLAETRLCEDLWTDWEELETDTDYAVELRYVNHVGKNPARFASLGFKTL